MNKNSKGLFVDKFSLKHLIDEHGVCIYISSLSPCEDFPNPHFYLNYMSSAVISKLTSPVCRKAAVRIILGETLFSYLPL